MNDDNLFYFRLSIEAKVITIHELFDIEKLSLISDISFTFNKIGIDFDELSKTHDGIFLTEQGQSRTRLDSHRGMNMYGWDCESILVLRTKNLIITDAEGRDSRQEQNRKQKKEENGTKIARSI